MCCHKCGHALTNLFKIWITIGKKCTLKVRKLLDLFEEFPPDLNLHHKKGSETVSVIPTVKRLSNLFTKRKSPNYGSILIKADVLFQKC